MGSEQSVISKNKKQTKTSNPGSVNTSKNTNPKETGNLKDNNEETLTISRDQHDQYQHDQSAIVSWLYSKQTGILLDEIIYPVLEILLNNEQIKFAIAEAYLNYLKKKKASEEEKNIELTAKDIGQYFLYREKIELEQEKIVELNKNIHAWNNVDLLSFMINVGERETGLGDFACRACAYFRSKYFVSVAKSFLKKFNDSTNNDEPATNELLERIYNLPDEKFKELELFNSKSGNSSDVETVAFFDVCLLYSALKFMFAFKTLKQRRLDNHIELEQPKVETTRITKKNSKRFKVFPEFNLDLVEVSKRNSVGLPKEGITYVGSPRTPRVKELQADNGFFERQTSPRDKQQTPRLTPRVESSSIEDIQKKIDDLLNSMCNFEAENHSELNKHQDDNPVTQTIMPAVETINLVLRFITRLACVVDKKDSQLVAALLKMQPIFTDTLILWKQMLANFLPNLDSYTPRLC